MEEFQDSIEATFHVLMTGCLCKTGDIVTFKYLDKDMSLNNKILLTSTLTTLFRINIIPFDTIDTNVSIYGKNGYKNLRNDVKNIGIKTLYRGCGAWGVGTFFGNYGWFTTYSLVNKDSDNSHIKNGVTGFMCSASSDLVSNPFRAMKTIKQTTNKSYGEIFSYIGEVGILNFYRRGLNSRLLNHGLQSSVFFYTMETYRKHNFARLK